MALLFLVWIGGFAVFVLNQAGPAPEGTVTDAVAVLTGGPGRLARGKDVLNAGLAKRMLVSGVDPSVRPNELAESAGFPSAMFTCCVDLGFEADSTRSNGDEVARWVERHGFRSVRLVTAGYHMPRAQAELEARLPPGVVVVPDGVRAGLPLWSMLIEYGKFQASWAMLRVRPVNWGQ
ncbi:YdcF family protein [Sandaracinobacteroides hominis]|uniref:YdcF family protein n=1 Tax=Sandaracinobacteroides hominis TaxID=2780086 RepID=UPI0018F65736|nr:YdcF family protein [Sandaracinobacteroides hominis]